MTSVVRQMMVTAAASLALAGCANCSLDALRALAEGERTETRRSEAKTAAVERKPDHAAVKKAEPAPQQAEPAAPAVEVAADPTDEKRKWCGQRFIDYQDGKRPGGAQTIEQKQADDRACEALKQGGQIETGSIPKQ